jgi:hypothetical protein
MCGRRAAATARRSRALPFKGRVGWGGDGVDWLQRDQRQHHPHPGPPLEGEGEKRPLDRLRHSGATGQSHQRRIDIDPPSVCAGAGPQRQRDAQEPSPSRGGLGGDGVDWLQRDQRQHHPHPGPPLQGEGEKRRPATRRTTLDSRLRGNHSSRRFVELRDRVSAASCMCLNVPTPRRQARNLHWH